MIDSPANMAYTNFIQIERDSSMPIYLQIANCLIQAISRGQLKPGSKLIGTRQLSQQLGVHRNTATAVYEELMAQGWLDMIPNRGTFVASQLPNNSTHIKSRFTYPKQTGFTFKSSFLLDNPFEHTNCQFVWNDGIPDIRLTQIDDISRIYSANLKRHSNRKRMGYYNQEGSEYFKEQLLEYLRLSRGLRIDSKNLLITRSMEMSLYIISAIILKAGDAVVVAELGYFSANMIFQQSGSRMLTVPVDAEGLDCDALRELCRKQTIRMVYVTPHIHYPTTVSLSAKRRMELLQLAKEYNFVIVEDDHDYDFQYDKPALVPLASHDEEGMLIYVSSFGKSLAPGFRTGFIVCPENLLIEMRKYLGLIDRQGDVLMEQALGEMIEDGVINRHLKKSLKVYRERRNAMAVQLSTEFHEHIDFQIPNGGLAYWIRWKKPINLLQLSQRASKQDLFIPKTLLYQNRENCAMRIGFGNMNEEEMKASFAIFKRLLEG